MLVVVVAVIDFHPMFSIVEFRTVYILFRASICYVVGMNLMIMVVVDDDRSSISA